ncbi:2-deoxy-5-keto-D-gluconate 6-phosphate aldolase domain-containing protein [Streptomyces polygonati]|uniref:2-deoxy-5-keto-D-gluconate 6-phosphate aldolase domain-containing protein n=1 Tax=Streptomyces polygonati TaxID=1617087 RepID=A0ABV8HUE1_9ACTN
MTDPNGVSEAPAPSSAASLFLLAMDHRASLARTVYGIKGEPTSAQAALISAGKQLVFQGLLAALDIGADRARTGVLVDERYGAPVARQARDAGLVLAMPIERSGEDWFTLEYGTLGEDRWLEHVEAFDPDHVKILVRDNPGFDPGRRRAQQDDLAAVTSALHDRGRSLLLELLVPATAEQSADQGQDYDTALRPRLTRQVITEMQQAGVEPDIWKIEGLDSAEDAARAVATAQQGGRDQVRCVVLGRDAPAPVLDRWLSLAAGVTGFEGFAIGRSIWEDPLAAHLAGQATEGETVRPIADRYLHYVTAYERAARR